MMDAFTVSFTASATDSSGAALPEKKMATAKT